MGNTSIKSVSCLSLLLPALLFCASALANLPGNYTQTGKNISRAGETPATPHRRANRSWVHTESTFGSCRHPVANCNGKLVDKPACNRKRTGQHRLPA